MDGENNGRPYEQMDDLGGPPLFLETHIWQKHILFKLNHVSPIFGVETIEINNLSNPHPHGGLWLKTLGH